MKRNDKIILILILIFAALLRFYQLGGIPHGFHRDEAFLGYNAFSLMLTGKEMAGNFFPVHLASFLFSPSGYSYLSIPSIFIFGLNEFSVRFTSAFFGSLTVVLVYFLVQLIFSGYRYRSHLGLLSSFLLALSPWHINLSRVATENVLVVFFITLGLILYFLWISKKNFWLFMLSLLCFSGTLLIYQAPRAFLPLLLPLLFIFYRPKPLRQNLILPIFFFIIMIILPVILIVTSHDLSQRIRMLSIFQHPQTQLILDEQIRENGIVGTSPVISRIFHNKVINYSSTFLDNYFSHFSYDFLFTDSGMPDRYRVPQMGLLYLFEFPVLLIGIWKLISDDKKKAGFILGWILLAPLGSALTYDDIPNLQRTLLIFPAISIVIAYGFVHLFHLLNKLRFKQFVKVFITFIILYNIAFYFHQYYIHQVVHRPWYRQEGYKQLAAEVNKLIPQYSEVVVTDWESDPAIFFLFYNSYNPSAIQERLQSSKTKEYGVSPFDKFKFTRDECPLREEPVGNGEPSNATLELKGKMNVLYINHGTCKISNSRVKTYAEIKRSDNTVVYKIQAIEK